MTPARRHRCGCFANGVAPEFCPHKESKHMTIAMAEAWADDAAEQRANSQ